MDIRLRGGRSAQLGPVEWVINCSGPDSHTRAVQPLLRQLLASGEVAADDLQLGLLASPDGRLLDIAGKPCRGLLAIGPLLKGTLWETTAVPELRMQAAALAQRIRDTLATAAGGKHVSMLS